MPPVVIDTPWYQVRWRGELPFSRVSLTYDREMALHFTGSEREYIEREWVRVSRGSSWIFDLPLYRLLSATGDASCLVLWAGKTSYKEYLCTNVAKPYWAIDNPDLKMANPLAISIVAVTADSRIIVQRRSELVAKYPGRLHITPSGHIHPPHSLEEAVYDELFGEIAVRPDEVAGEMVATGLIVNKEDTKPELTARIHLTISFDEILARSAHEGWEYREIIPYAWEGNTVGGLLTDRNDELVPPGHAAILLAGAVDFGERWLDRVIISGDRS